MNLKATTKPSKPSPDFPLFPHASGKWAKKINGATKYFGRWDDPDGALSEYHALLAHQQARRDGVAPPAPQVVAPSGLTINKACDLFLDAKKVALDSNEMSFRTFHEYTRTCKRFTLFFGHRYRIGELLPSDFTRYRNDRAKTCNPVTVGNEVTRVKTLLNWLYKSKHTRQIDTGPEFRKPSRLVTRRHKRQRGKLMFDAFEIRAILDEIGVQMRAMTLLAINCAYQNSDVETVTLDVVQSAIETGWIEYPRLKTEVDRRCPLWTTTRKALERAMKRRPESPLNFAFVLPDGRALTSTNGDVGKRFRAARDHAMIKQGG